MVLDKITNIDKYKNLGHNFKVAIEYLKNIDINKLKPGRNEIDGNNVFAVNITRDSFVDEDSFYEMHQSYADIHFVIEESESMYYEHPQYLHNVLKPFDKGEDVSLFKLDSSRNKLNLLKNEFAIFFPNEAHVPAVLNEKRKMRKIVIKVKI